MTHGIRRLKTSAYLEINYYKRPAQWRMGMHRHSHFQILIVLAGELVAEIPHRKKMVCPPGELLFIPPPFLHRLSSPGGYEQVGINTTDAASVDERGILPLLKGIAEPVLIPLPPRLAERLRSLSEMGPLTPRDRLNLLHLADAIMVYLIDCMTEKMGRENRRERLDRLLEASLRKTLVLGDAAREMNLSVPHLERLANRYFGRGLVEEHLERKADLACRLLAGSDESLENLSRNLGFSSAAYFSRFFKRRVGMAPSLYRKRFD